MLFDYLIDYWSVCHLVTWFTFTLVALGLFNPKDRLWVLCWSIAAGVVWELLEVILVEPLLNFREPFWNRWFTDLVADWLGAGMAFAFDSILLQRIKNALK